MSDSPIDVIVPNGLKDGKIQLVVCQLIASIISSPVGRHLDRLFALRPHKDDCSNEKGMVRAHHSAEQTSPPLMMSREIACSTPKMATCWSYRISSWYKH